MTSLFPARRSAERFDSLVEGGRRDDVDRANADLLELVSALRSVARAAGPARVRRRPARAAHARRRGRADAGPDRRPRARRRRAAHDQAPPHPPRAPARHRTRRASRSSAPPPRWRWPPRARSRVTSSTRSSGRSRTPRPASASATTPRARPSSTTPPTRLDEVGKLAQQDDARPAAGHAHPQRLHRAVHRGGNSLLADYESNGNEGSIEQIHSDVADSMPPWRARRPDPAGRRHPTDGWSAAHDALLTPRRRSSQIDAQAANLCPTAAPGSSTIPPQLLAGGGQALTDAANNVAGGELPGADVPGPRAPPSRQNGGKGRSDPERPEPARDADPDPDPAQRRRDRPRRPAPDRWHRHGTGGGERQRRQRRQRAPASGGKDVEPSRRRLAPVTDTVNEVVTGVVEGVTGLLNGLDRRQSARRTHLPPSCEV